MSLRTRNVFSGKKLGKTRIYTRDDLEIGTRFKGPAVIHEYSTTTYVPPDFGLTVDTFENLILMSGKK